MICGFPSRPRSTGKILVPSGPEEILGIVATLVFSSTAGELIGAHWVLLGLRLCGPWVAGETGHAAFVLGPWALSGPFMAVAPRASSPASSSHC